MLDVRRSPELQAALLGVRQAHPVVGREINKEARRTLNPDWTAALKGEATSRADDRIIVQGAKTAVSTRQVSVKAATSGRPLSGGLVPKYQWQGQEFGMTEKMVIVKSTSSRGRQFSGPRIVGRQFPARTKFGRVAYAAAGKVGTRLVRGWVQVIIKHFALFADIRAGR